MENSKNKMNIGVLFYLALYSLSVFIYRDFNIPTIAGYFVLFAVLGLALINSNFRLKVSGTVIAFSVLALFQSVCILTSYLKNGESVFIMYIPAFFMCIFCMMLSSPNTFEVDKVVKLWKSICIFSSMYVLLVYFFPNIYYTYIHPRLSYESQVINASLISKGYGVSLGGNAVMIDYILAFMIIFLVNAVIAESKHKEYKGRRINIVLLIIFLSAMFFVNRKSEMIALVASIVFMFLYNGNYSSINLRIRRILQLAVIGASVIGLSVVLYNSDLLGRYGSFISMIEKNDGIIGKVDITSGRLILWRVAYGLFLQKPLFGIGWGRFADYVPVSMRTGDVDGYILKNVHNCYLQLLCETGVVGFTVFMSAIIYIFRKLLYRGKYIKEKGIPLPIRNIHATCIGYQIFFLVVSFIDPCMYKLIFWCFYTITVIISNWVEQYADNFQKTMVENHVYTH